MACAWMQALTRGLLRGRDDDQTVTAVPDERESQE